jgi:hypothetical protein
MCIILCKRATSYHITAPKRGLNLIISSDLFCPPARNTSRWPHQTLQQVNQSQSLVEENTLVVCNHHVHQFFYLLGLQTWCCQLILGRPPLQSSLVACYRVISDLFQKYRCDDIPCSIKPIVFIDTDKERWDDALNRLQFEILPPIRQPLHTLLESLHPSNHQAIKFLIMIFSQAFSRVWSRV